MSEAQLDAIVRQLAALLGVRVYSVRNSKAGVVTSRGYPDLTIVGPAGIAFRELKSSTGKLTAEQAGWGDALAAAGQDWGVWRPEHWHTRAIETELRALAKRRPHQIEGTTT
jgi:hypothetical protein